MAPQYRIVTKTAAGVKLADVTDYIELAYLKQVNAPGALQFRLNGSHAAINNLELNSQIEVYRRDPVQDIDWYVDFYGLFRGQEQYVDWSAEGADVIFTRKILDAAGNGQET